MNKWVLRLSITALILAVSITVSLLVSPGFFFLFLLFPFEFLLPWVRTRPKGAS